MICAIVLAAGRSRRMGTQKLLLPWDGKTIIAHITDELLRSKIDRVFVVISSETESVRVALAGRNVAFVMNPNPDSEMLDSVRCGLRALPSECEAVIVATGDQPTVTAELVSEVIRAFCDTGKGIVIPTFNNKRGHPMVFSARFRDEVLREFDGDGLHGLRLRYPTDVLELPVRTPLDDVDTPSDYERLRARQVSPK